MSEQVTAPPDAAGRGPSVSHYVAIAIPIVLAAFSFWSGWRSSGGIAYTLHAAGAALAILAGLIVFGIQRIQGPQDYFGGLALIALSLFAFWASNDLPGMRGFSFGPGTAPRLFSAVLLTFGIVITAMGLVMEGRPLEKYAVRGPFWITVSIFIFATTVRPLGLIIATFVSFVVAGAGSKETKWVENVIAAVVMTAFSVLLFVYLLALPFQLWPRF